MAYLEKGGQNSTGSNPVLDLYTFVSGVLTDAFSVKFKIYDITDSAKKTTYYSGNKNDVQVFPSTPGTYFTLDVANLATDLITPGHKLSTGHYYGPWDVPSDAAIGDYIVEWVYKQNNGGPDLVFAEEFVVINAGATLTGLTKLEKLKLFMQDQVNKNELIDELEYTDQQYILAMELCIDKYNATTPIECYTIDTFPTNLQYVFIMGAVGLLLRSTSIEQLRNQLTYTDGNIHVGLKDKHRDYIQAGMAIMQEWEQMVRGIKNQTNNDSAWGDSSSPYRAVSSIPGSGVGWYW